MPDDVVEEVDSYDVELLARAAMWNQISGLVGDVRVVTSFLVATIKEHGAEALVALREDLADRKKK